MRRGVRADATTLAAFTPAADLNFWLTRLPTCRSAGSRRPGSTASSGRPDGSGRIAHQAAGQRNRNAEVLG